jgi:NADH-quinone oxidoreductase subunit H
MSEQLILILEWTIKSVLLALILLGGFAYTTLYERKFLARIQVRIGPNRAGPWAIFQPIADAIKLIFKEELVPANAYKVAFLLAPILTMTPAIVIMAVIPWGDSVTLFGREIHLGISSDINVGVLYLLSIASIAVYGIVLAGWSSNNKYAMMGGLRSTAQMISYELALGLSFLPPVMLAGSMSMMEIVQGQFTDHWLFFSNWYVWKAPVAAVICFIAMVAEVNRGPFDMPEAEQELTAGYHAEYSGMKFALFFMGEYIKMISVSAIFSTLFLGGFDGPFVDQLPILGPLYLVAKIFVSLGIMIWVRASLPRFRYDRLMAFGWKRLLPISLVNVFVTAAIIVGWNYWF